MPASLSCIRKSRSPGEFFSKAYASSFGRASPVSSCQPLVKPLGSIFGPLAVSHSRLKNHNTKDEKKGATGQKQTRGVGGKEKERRASPLFLLPLPLTGGAPQRISWRGSAYLADLPDSNPINDCNQPYSTSPPVATFSTALIRTCVSQPHLISIRELSTLSNSPTPGGELGTCSSPLPSSRLHSHRSGTFETATAPIIQSATISGPL
jgi:hypothetical protein